MYICAATERPGWVEPENSPRPASHTGRARSWCARPPLEAVFFLMLLFNRASIVARGDVANIQRDETSAIFKWSLCSCSSRSVAMI
jgi:hypothetical protein